MKKETRTLLIGGVVLLVAVVVLSVTERARQHETTRPQAKSTSLEYMLATIDKGYVSKDDIIITRFRSLLQTLDAIYVENKKQIADLTVTAQNILRDRYGIKETLLNIMEGMNQVHVTKINPSYKFYTTAYIQLRKSGQSHQQALIGIESFLKSIGRW